jgi:hypothetical protein
MSKKWGEMPPNTTDKKAADKTPRQELEVRPDR